MSDTLQWLCQLRKPGFSRVEHALTPRAPTRATYALTADAPLWLRPFIHAHWVGRDLSSRLGWTAILVNHAVAGEAAVRPRIPTERTRGMHEAIRTGGCENGSR
ncbi:MAG: hypothetical protein JWO52_1524, partial [Gammaproteobacteria bacterium]|nr:hypothetical protein [Gammaproteobacteria bacterium]